MPSCLVFLLLQVRIYTLFALVTRQYYQSYVSRFIGAGYGVFSMAQKQGWIKKPRKTKTGGPGMSFCVLRRFCPVANRPLPHVLPLFPVVQLPLTNLSGLRALLLTKT
jgi:hypothetical protein